MRPPRGAPSDEPRQGGGDPFRHRPRDGRRRRGAGRRPRVRPRGAADAAAAHRRRESRCGVRVALSRRPASRAVFLALGGKPPPHPAVEHAHRPEPHRHGDVLQAGARRPAAGPPAHGRAVRHRAGAHSPARPGGRPHLGNADLLLRPHLRRGEEDHVARRLRGAGPHPPLQPVPAGGRVAPPLNRFTPGRAGLAVALGRGLGFVHPHLPGTPAVVHYPPLYPLLLAPLFGAFPVPTAAYIGKLLNLLLAALSAGLIAWHAARVRLLGDDAPEWLAPGVVAAAVIAIPVLATQAVLFSEPLFGVLLAAAVILADAPPARVSPVTGAALAGCAAALALLTRSIGVAAGAGIVLFLVAARRAPRHVTLAAAAPVALAALGWGLWLLRHRGGIDPALAMNYGSYLETVRQAGLGVFWPATRALLRPLGDLTLGLVAWTPIYYVCAAAAALVGGYGVSLLLRRSSVGWTLVFYLLILAVWPFPSDRFLWGVLPWLGLAWTAGETEPRK